ncbi:nitroreductase [Clostridium sp. MF28]|uniref:nitroreductase family protein n=1 Tax=Clostridium TaxID=1485 RepID=UPI000CF8D3A0|nr:MULTISPECIES: nitroreductase family protein [Clostridium]AVK49356.1 nitroreductase [Clostridium sp. MF28]PSM58030.1 nitroreductase [Clostridium diolis]
MNFLDLAKIRYSVRKYEDKIVEKEKLDKILEAGRVAPTAANFQPQKLIVVQNKENLEKLKTGTNAYGAPLVIIVCSDHSQSWKRSNDGKDSADVDAGIVTDHMMLQATELGLGSVCIGIFDAKIIKECFNIPDNIEPINILAIGYSAVEAESKAASPDRHIETRKSLNETVFYETL